MRPKTPSPRSQQAPDYTGWWFHTLSAEGRIQHQGQLLKKNRIDYSARLYDNFGAPCEDLTSIAISAVHDPARCALYRSNTEMIAAAAQEAPARRQRAREAIERKRHLANQANHAHHAEQQPTLTAALNERSGT